MYRLVCYYLALEWKIWIEGQAYKVIEFWCMETIHSVLISFK